MSSRYTIICLTHDPAISEDGADYGSPEEAVGAVVLGTGARAAHLACDVVIGRWSYPLIEVGCPAGGRSTPGRVCVHSGPQWLDVGWLRLLHHARMNDDAADRLVGSDAMCWPAARLDRLEPLFRREDG